MESIVLPRRQQERIVVGNDVVVSIIEICEDVIRLRIMPSPGTTPDHCPEVSPIGPGGEGTDPEVSVEDGRPIMVLPTRIGGGVLINKTTQLQVVSATPEVVQVRITPSPQPVGSSDDRSSPTGPEQADTNLSGVVGPAGERNTPTTVAAEVFLDWIAGQINEHVENQPRGALRRLAATVGVAPASIARWRTRQANVATKHATALLKALDRSLDDLARYLKVERVCLPEIKTRGLSGERQESGSGSSQESGRRAAAAERQRQRAAALRRAAGERQRQKPST
jgi:hypothetical protein